MIAMPQAVNAPASAAAPYDFAAARFNMIEGQLRPNKVSDARVLAVMGDLPRELFVPSTLVGVAYADENIPLISDRMLMQPMVLARLVQAAEISANDRVLDLAPATGYSTLILAALAKSVIGVEPDAVLYAEAEANLAAYGQGRAHVLAGAPVEGCISHPPHAPFDVIFINGSVEFLPAAVLKQLAEGGRLVVVMREYGPAHAAHTGQARLYRKTKGEITWTPLFDVNIPPAPGFLMPLGFVF